MVLDGMASTAGGSTTTMVLLTYTLVVMALACVAFSAAIYIHTAAAASSGAPAPMLLSTPRGGPGLVFSPTPVTVTASQGGHVDLIAASTTFTPVVSTTSATTVLPSSTCSECVPPVYDASASGTVTSTGLTETVSLSSDGGGGVGGPVLRDTIAFPTLPNGVLSMPDFAFVATTTPTSPTLGLSAVRVIDSTSPSTAALYPQPASSRVFVSSALEWARHVSADGAVQWAVDFGTPTPSSPPALWFSVSPAQVATMWPTLVYTSTVPRVPTATGELADVNRCYVLPVYQSSFSYAVVTLESTVCQTSTPLPVGTDELVLDVGCGTLHIPRESCLVMAASTRAAFGNADNVVLLGTSAFQGRAITFDVTRERFGMTP